MCGIVGYLNLNGQELNPDLALLTRMCRTISHRGPDEEGMKIVGPAALGMRRLAIIDLKTGQQPITNEDKSCWIVFNGEIYNYQSLQKKVLSLGHKLATNCDTEIIVHLYEEYGVDCLKYLEGMFAFAIWDGCAQRLFVARDRMGEKPLHWTISNGQFIFGSEIKGILAHTATKQAVNLEALEQYLALEYVPAPNSLFAGINKLMPAHFLLVEHGLVTTHNYWQPQTETIERSEAEAQKELETLLAKSVELRLISDVPLGVFLSGGIDSSTIAALAANRVKGKLKTFSIGFADRSFDESEHAKAIAHHLDTDHQTFEFAPNLAQETMHELWEILDEPLADASIMPTYFLSKMTKRHVTVALAGEGGDELFGGYPTYQAHKLALFWQTLPNLFRQGLLKPAVQRLPVSMNNLSFDYKVKRFVAHADESAIERHLSWMGAFPLQEQTKLLRIHQTAGRFQSGSVKTLEEILAIPGLTRSLMPTASNAGSNGADLLETIMRVDLSTYLPDDLLVKSDRSSMAASLEVRLPFLAYPLVEFALTLPSHLKLRSLTSKYLLRQMAKSYLPQKTVNRPKKGFGIPVAKWINNEFKSTVDKLLAPAFLHEQGIFNPLYVENLLREHRSEYTDRRKEIWTLLMFQCWWRKFF